MTKKIINYILLGFLILLVSYIVSNHYVYQLLKCDVLGCVFDFDRITFFPWTDFSENIVGGMDVSNGYVFGRDFSQPHFPGIYITLGQFFSFINANSFVPSIATAVILIFYSVIAFIAFVIISLRSFFNVSQSVVLMASVLLLLPEWSLYLVMSETVAFWLSIGLFYGLYKIIEGEYKKIGMVLVSSILTTYAGLGFPSILAGSLLIIFLILTVRGDWFVLRAKSTIIPVSIASLYIIYSLARHSDINELYYWAVGINRVITPNLFSNIWANFQYTSNITKIQEYLLSIPVSFGLLFLFVCKCRKHVFWYVAMYLVVVLPLLWRSPFGYKILPLASFNLVTLFLLFSTSKIVIRVSSLLILSLIFTVGAYAYNNNLNALNVKFAQTEDPLFSDESICKFKGENSISCKCLSVLVFGPQVFLQNNVQQCKGIMNTWCDRLGTSEKYTNIMYEKVMDPSTSFTVPSSKFYENDLPLNKIVDKIHDVKKCKRINNDFEFCN